ncbi:MAG: LysR substrate-binding domain-containing protein, partial [Pseudomonadota bacterium]
FERGPRGVRLTPLGRLFLERMDGVEREMHNFASEIQAYKRGIAGTVRLGVGQFWLGAILPNVLAKITQTAPEIQVKVHTGAREDLIMRLKKGEIDYMLARITEDLPTEFIGEALADIRLYIVVRKGHPILQQKGPISPEALYGLKWILPPRADPRIRYAFTEHGIEPPTPAIEAVSWSLTATLLQAGDYVTVMSEITIDKYADGLQRLEVNWLGRTGKAGVIRARERPLLPCCDKFLTLLRDEARLEQSNSLRIPA